MRSYALLIAICTSVPAFGQEFDPGHAFVASFGNGRVVEYDETGAKVRDLGLDDDLGQVTGLAFGPDGLLYVASQSKQKVFVFSGSGELVRDFEVDPGGSPLPQGLAFGPEGHLFIAGNLSSRIYRFDVSSPTPTLVDSFATGPIGPIDLCLGPNGHLYVTSFGGNRVREYAVDGSELNPIEGADLIGPTDVTFGRFGQMWVASFATDAGGVLRMASSGAESLKLSTPGLVEARGLAFGADGRLYVSVAGDRVAVVDPQTGVELGELVEGLQDPRDVVFSPQRLPVKVSGRVVAAGRDFDKVKSKGILSVLPFSRSFMLQLDQDLDGPAGLLTQTMVFHGFESFDDVAQPVWMIDGQEVRENASDDGIARVDLKAKLAAKGPVLLMKKATGSLAVSGRDGSFIGKVKTLKQK